MKQRRLLISIGFVFFSILLNAQNFNSNFCKSTSINPKDSSKLFLTVENTNFFKNDEFFGDLTSGITYIGTFVQPKLVYYPYKKVKIQAGVHLLKYSGLDIFSQYLPVFSFQYSPSKSVDFIMGTINGGANHRLLEPFYTFENHLINNVENGAQLLIHNRRLSADIWLNWERFILKTSYAQESIIGGLKAKFLFTNPDKASKFFIDFQTMFAHKGGQFHSPEEKLQTLANSAIGLIWNKDIEKGLLENLGMKIHYLSFSDPSPLPQLPYTMGYALYTQAFMQTKLFYTSIAYWSGEYFISPYGSPLFMSISDKNDSFVLPRTELITAKIALRKQLYKDIMFEARFEPYYDIQQNILEYSYGFHIIFNTSFFLKSFKK